MAKADQKEQRLYAMRHSMAHIMATAIQELYPQAKFGIGPVVENGFYYDVELPESLTAEDLAKIEAKMREVVKADYPFEHSQMKLEEAVKYFGEKGQGYKVELLNDLKKHGTTVAKEIDQAQLGVETGSKVDEVSIYKDGPFTDLCRGPHVESTGKVGAFKLMRVSGAYWRGNENNAQLQRVYGVGFTTKDELKAHLAWLEESKKRDHRKLGQELDLFAFSDLIGAGLPVWTPRGTFIKSQIQQALLEASKRQRMMPVSIPHLAKIDLYETSGHAQKFGGELFKVTSHYKQEFVLKPVNCPHHTQIYASRPRSYRDLPLRYMESTMQYRDEKPGEIGGLTRTRGFTVDDGHLFIRADQIHAEVAALCEVVKEFYTALGMYGDHWVSLSVRDRQNLDGYIGSSEDWDLAESMLAKISEEKGLDAVRMEGEAAIYGPKLDFMFKDALGNERQLATIQLDFAMPKRFNLTYTDKDGKEVNPVMIHRAILGSYERFVAILIEHFAGAFPLWLSPEQVRLVTVNDDEATTRYARVLADRLRESDLQVEVDDSNETVGKKIRNAGVWKVPYTIVVGEKEVQSGKVSPRLRQGHGEFEGELPVDEFVATLRREVEERAAQSLLSK